MTDRTRRHWCAAIIVVASIATGCSASSHSSGVPAATVAGPKETVLSIGGSATEGDGVRNRLQDAWPYLVFHQALPASTIFVNGALDGATVANALTLQAPLATELKPNIVEVLLGADDLRAATPIPAFTVALTQLLHALRVSASTRVLVADLPTVYGAGAAPYNAAIRAVVGAAHSELVDLADATITLAPVEGLPPQPDTASHRVIAAAFEQVIAKSN
jgi:lysophospholipase L1-like esterase